jgi:hypothetical protein
MPVDAGATLLPPFGKLPVPTSLGSAEKHIGRNP